MAKAGGVMRHLWDALRGLTLGELLQLDFFIAVGGGVGGVYLAVKAPERLLAVVDLSAGVVGVTIGAVLAGVAIQSAFLDQAFLRKLRAINRDPIDYLAPFLFTSVVGIFALLGLLVMSTLTPSTPTAVLVALGGPVGLFSLWAISSLLPGLATLVQFVGLRMDALDVPDDVDIAPKRSATN